MKREDIIREVQSMLPDHLNGYQIAKSIVKLADLPDDTYRRIGKKRARMKRSMSAQEARRLVDAAKRRLELDSLSD